MNILYISHLSTNIAAGLNWSVPASVKAQSKIDNVLWINMTDKLMNHWTDVPSYHNIKDFGGELRLESLPDPFNHPDVVVFEGFYYMDDVRFAKKLRKERVPYIIIPRSSLTHLAMNNHARLKKWIAHKLFFDKFVKHAVSIQYLTKQEADDSTDRFHTPYFITPNGFEAPSEIKTSFSDNKIMASFIGRLDMFQKGLDILIDAVTEIKADLIKANFHLDIFGPRRYDYEKIASIIENNKVGEIVTLNNEVSGEVKKKILLDSDVFIMTSRFEGHPMGLIEALSYGIPCLVTPGTNMYDKISKENAGWVCDGSKNSIKVKLMEIVNDKKSFKEKSKNAVQLSKHYNWADVALRFHNEIKSILEEKSQKKR